MALIPQIVFEKYAEFADAMVDELGDSCILVYPDTIVTTNQTVPSIRQKKTMILDGTDAFARSDEEFITIENRETVKFRVYWDARSFKKFSDLVFPDGSVMCISKLVTLPKIRKATYLIIHKVTDGSHEEYKFTKFKEPQLHGLNNNYVMSVWQRA